MEFLRVYGRVIGLLRAERRLAIVLALANIAVAGLQFYATTGGGIYRERLGTTHQETNVAANTGGGVKISLLGPVKVRIDYRVFRLSGAPIHRTPQRVYVGLNLGF